METLALRASMAMSVPVLLMCFTGIPCSTYTGDSGCLGERNAALLSLK